MNIKDQLAIQALYNRQDFAPAVEPITRESIASMSKADVAELLEAHGADATGKVGDMRDRLVSIMFIDA